MKKRNKGFSLIELIVVISIMAILLACLAPALLNNIEKSKVKKDEQAMDKIANTIQLAMTDENIFNEITRYVCKNNRTGYIDPTTDEDAESFKQSFSDGSYNFEKESRLDDEISYYPAGESRGATITFVPDSENRKTVFKIKDARINNMSGVPSEKNHHELTKEYAYEKMTTISSMYYQDAEKHLLYDHLKSVIGDTVPVSSRTYKNSEYTIFVRIAPLGGMIEGGDPIQVYGQWNGTNLPEKETHLTPEPPDPVYNNRPTPPKEPDKETEVIPPPPIETEPSEETYTIIVDNKIDGENEIIYNKIKDTQEIKIQEPQKIGYLFTGYTLVYGEGKLIKSKTGFNFTCQKSDARLDANWKKIENGIEVNDPDSDYIYRFNQNYNFSYAYGGAWEDAPSQNGWGVLVKPEKRGQVSFQPIKEEIGGYPIKSLHSTFHKCFNMVEAPVIPESVTDVKLTFLECRSLLKAPHIPEGVTRMDETFEYCSYMVTPSNIPANVQSAKYTYYCCYSLNGTVTIDTNHIDKFGDGNPSETNSAFAAFYKVDMSKVTVVGKASNKIKNWFGCLGYNWEYLPE